MNASVPVAVVHATPMTVVVEVAATVPVAIATANVALLVRKAVSAAVTVPTDPASAVAVVTLHPY